MVAGDGHFPARDSDHPIEARTPLAEGCAGPRRTIERLHVDGLALSGERRDGFLGSGHRIPQQRFGSDTAHRTLEQTITIPFLEESSVRASHHEAGEFGYGFD